MFVTVTHFYVSVQDPWNGCQYTCALCDKVLESVAKFRAHIIHTHSLEYKSFIYSHGLPVTKINKVYIIIVDRNDFYLLIFDVVAVPGVFCRHKA